MSKYVFITGATAGFGKATAEIFAKNGFNLILAGRRIERLQQLKKDLQEFSVDIQLLHFDVRFEDECKNAILSLEPTISSQITLLVNNAGLAVGRGSIAQGESEDWNRMIDTNFKGLLYVSKYVIPFMQKNKSGHIVNIASIAGKEVYPGGNVYCASKHAVDALSQAMRIDLVADNIKVTNIAPGAADTEFSLVRFKGDKQTADSVYDGFTPLYAQDIAETVYFVATRPAHVNINDIVIMPTAQASAQVFHKTN
ncbi:MAG: SDR family NAD(P)-dependent oxidoreductase [Crocinitomicaceae bacterium]|jgi:NADP-dependent 3-hydroxy acid dehydrogenase YdfG|nr:SDR family NAD(P)-dependent oxidoreductase [Crocinitomicaceae bacterium]